ncbi:hypothetical protein ABPG72_012474 [Tetrahymena utriculariae]
MLKAAALSILQISYLNLQNTSFLLRSNEEKEGDERNRKKQSQILKFQNSTLINQQQMEQQSQSKWGYKSFAALFVSKKRGRYVYDRSMLLDIGKDIDWYGFGWVGQMYINIINSIVQVQDIID